MDVEGLVACYMEVCNGAALGGAAIKCVNCGHWGMHFAGGARAAMLLAVGHI